MDFVIWLNTLFLIFAAVAEGIILYVVLQEVRKGNEMLSRSNESLARVEPITLATLSAWPYRTGSSSANEPQHSPIGNADTDC
jgi:hypothetical protein